MRSPLPTGLDDAAYSGVARTVKAIVPELRKKAIAQKGRFCGCTVVRNPSQRIGIFML
ncbi:MAG TPA: hypothetical protein VMU05_04205 [Dongiaceae bacterium]|nr:hypothetical protein [Dongiaceae bacterium]